MSPRERLLTNGICGGRGDGRGPCGGCHRHVDGTRARRAQHHDLGCRVAGDLGRRLAKMHRRGIGQIRSGDRQRGAACNRSLRRVEQRDRRRLDTNRDVSGCRIPEPLPASGSRGCESLAVYYSLRKRGSGADTDSWKNPGNRVRAPPSPTQETVEGRKSRP